MCAYRIYDRHKNMVIFCKIVIVIKIILYRYYEKYIILYRYNDFKPYVKCLVNVKMYENQ